MVPETGIDEDILGNLEELEEIPSYDFGLNTENKRISGTVEDLEAVKQAIYLILSAERYEHSIYPDYYGVELSDLIGQDLEWVRPELEMRITEALLMDERITEVTDFEFDTSEKGKVTASFTVETTKGTLEIYKEVPI